MIKQKEIIYIHRNHIDELIYRLRKLKKICEQGGISKEYQMPFLTQENKKIILGIKKIKLDGKE